MQKPTLITCILLTLSIASPALPTHAAGSPQLIRLAKPAEQWTEALPVGNGRLGAMVYGGYPLERIQINENSIWAGPPVPENADNLAPKLKEIRALFFNGQRKEAERRVAREIMGPRISPRSYQPVGTLTIRHLNAAQPSNILLQDWERCIDPLGSADAFQPESMESLRWQRVAQRDDRSVPTGRAVVFRSSFVIESDRIAGSPVQGTLHVSPIDDRSVIYLNGAVIGRTSDYGRSHQFDTPELRRGTNWLCMVVTNVGGPGHTADQVELRFTPSLHEYDRTLDLSTGVVSTQFTPDNNSAMIRQEVFACADPNVIVVRLHAARHETLNVEIGLSRVADFTTARLGDNGLAMRGQAQHNGRHLGVRWQALLRAEQRGGSITPHNDHLGIRDAEEITLTLTASTDYNMANPAEPLEKDLLAECVATLDTATGDLKQAAVAEHTRYFNRCSIELGSTPPEVTALPIPERLERLRQGHHDPDLIETYFQFGRYLLIGSSRPGTLPANLQGLWSEGLEAPWNADYHVNINIQMNYWPAEVTGLSELHQPFFWLLDGLRKDGRVLAQRLGCRGFAVTHTTDAWLWAAIIGSPQYGMWPLGAAWSSAHCMEHYWFTGDERFLREIGYPILKESAEFLLDWLVQDPQTGKLVSGPTTSPENSYRYEGQVLYLAMGNAMDQMIISENFRNVLEAARILGIEDPFVRRVRSTLRDLAMPQIGMDGRILEWDRPYEEAEPGHRHISHLYGLHPGCQFTPWDTPEYAGAARKVLEARLAQGGGHTGWSRAWIVNFYARLLDGDTAHGHLLELLRKSTLPNLFDTHPPFQIDGNFGGTAGIAEMLIQSHARNHVIHLLPALPTEWSTGSARGLRARGGFELDIEWDQGRLREVRVHSLNGNRCRLVHRDQSVEFDTSQGARYRLNETLTPTRL